MKRRHSSSMPGTCARQVLNPQNHGLYPHSLNKRNIYILLYLYIYIYIYIYIYLFIYIYDTWYIYIYCIILYYVILYYILLHHILLICKKYSVYIYIYYICIHTQLKEEPDQAILRCTQRPQLFFRKVQPREASEKLQQVLHRLEQMGCPVVIQYGK